MGVQRVGYRMPTPLVSECSKSTVLPLSQGWAGRESGPHHGLCKAPHTAPSYARPPFCVGRGVGGLADEPDICQGDYFGTRGSSGVAGESQVQGTWRAGQARFYSLAARGETQDQT